MEWLVKPQKIYLDLVVSWLRSEAAKINHVLTTIEETHDYQDEYIYESIKAAEMGLRRIRKFVDTN